ncbi:MAPEG family protein [Luteimonas sp. MHLX1A]|uniref:MAPEG family protein n=1 Tax=Alterluteimonas muca TaxID=2878684 RepID=UPI001E541940|nr:MAPEG family protein [Luteimonas sp. MHLX1A]MCD9045857.1 MAPEG family protein [Luteimonas sp. MHLX1A]
MESATLPLEIRMLAWAVLLGLGQLFLAAAVMTRQRGMRWNAGPRDGEPPPLSGVGARLDRAWRNYLETFGFFAAAVLAVVATGRGDAGTALGAQLYFWARVAYVPLYAAGIPYLRSLVWAVSVAGILMVLRGLV